MQTEEPHLLQEKVAESATDDEGSVVSLGRSYTKGELVIGLVGPVGTDFDRVVAILKNWLTAATYDVKEIRVSKQIIAQLVARSETPSGEFERISWAMTDGDKAREKSGDNSILALGAASRIAAMRDVDDNENPRPLGAPISSTP